jgi:hypothetical protein
VPFAFLIVGALFVVAAVRGQSKQLLSLVKADLTGKDNYLYWAVSILIIGALGYVDELRPLSRAFLILVLVVLVLSNGGFFKLFNQSLSVISQNGGATTSTSTNSDSVSGELPSLPTLPSAGSYSF